MKKAFVIILCAVMILSAAIPAVAIVNSARSADLVDGKLNIVIGELEEIEALPGAEVDVKIQFKNNVTISSAKILLTYDSKLSVVKNSSGNPEVTFDIYNDEDASAMTYATLYEDENKLLLNWLTAVDQVQGDVVFATVKFKVADDAEEGAFLPITAEIDPDDVYDIDINNTEFNLIDGGIRVIAKSEESTTEEDPGFLKGDCNDDGLVDNKDVVALFRYASAGTHVEDERKYDFNEDSEVNNKDVVELFRFVSKL